MAKVIRDGLESVVGVSDTRLIDVQGVGHNINAGGTNISWKMSLATFHSLKHDGWGHLDGIFNGATHSWNWRKHIFKDKGIQRMKYCRIYLNVTTIANAWGVWRKAMALWATEIDLKVPLKEWYFPAS
eukprot:1686215-Ditylum_brightwellii.AAC.1